MKETLLNALKTIKHWQREIDDPFILFLLGWLDRRIRKKYKDEVIKYIEENYGKETAEFLKAYMKKTTK